MAIPVISEVALRARRIASQAVALVQRRLRDEPGSTFSAWHIARAWPVLIAGAVFLLLLCLLYFGWFRPDVPAGVMPLPTPSGHNAPAIGPLATPTSPPIEQFLPEQTLQLTPQQALAKNLATPIAKQNPAPPAFSPNWMTAADLGVAKQCLATAIYYESKGEPAAGQLAVAQVVLNRLRHPRYPKAICDVVYQGAERKTGCQFTFACDGSLQRKPDQAGWVRAQAVAEAALHGSVSRVAGQATHYHTVWVYPVWAAELAKVAIVGNHVFYRPQQAYGDFAAFRAQHPFLPEITQDLLAGDTTLSGMSGPDQQPEAAPLPPPQVAGAYPLLPQPTVPESENGLVAAQPDKPEVAPTPTRRSKRNLFGSDHPHQPNLPIPDGN